MYDYIDFDFNFTYNKAMKEKVPGVLGDPVSARVPQILIKVLFISYDEVCLFMICVTVIVPILQL